MPWDYEQLCLHMEHGRDHEEASLLWVEPALADIYLPIIGETCLEKLDSYQLKSENCFFSAKTWLV